jgi:hypothetical protein
LRSRHRACGGGVFFARFAKEKAPWRTLRFSFIPQTKPRVVLATLSENKTRYLIEITGFYLVAGARNHQNLRPQPSSSLAGPDLRDLVSQLGIVAEAHSHFKFLLHSEV